MEIGIQLRYLRIIVRFKNKSQNMVRKAESVIDDCEIAQILPGVFDNDIFPSYDKVNIPTIKKTLKINIFMCCYNSFKFNL